MKLNWSSPEQIKELIMAILGSLKLVTATRLNRLTDTERRRLKLVDKLDDQIKCIEAASKNEAFMKSRKAWRTNDDGQDEHVTITRSVRPWWWQDIKGQLFIAIKYGTQPMELAKGKTAIQVSSLDELSKVMSSIKQAVLMGELDTQLDQAGLKTASRFKN
jgi:hypothetical protein